MTYLYGMRSRPYGIGCQPKGAEFICHGDEIVPTSIHNRAWVKYWSIIRYDSPLTEQECEDYDLVPLAVTED